MAVQQRKVTRSRKNMRRSHHALDTPTLTSCSKCGHKIQSHRVCRNCGYYKGQKVIKTENV